MNIGNRIKELRNSMGYTQEELGMKIGVKKAAIQKYEKGTVKNLKRSTIHALADALNVSPIYLMGWEEQQEDIAIGIDAETGNIIPQLDDEEISSTIKDILELPDEAQGELKYFIDLLKTKYRKD